ncbi:MAG: polymer-forming cytoskeletal protein [Gammaproteobacteria bacterium]|nr:MAG: polymer-forming cytoskeletal protein [Gammaproteobacteria bacterium]RLA59925.1 MAG: polymer-forming cytoskeletal protein [Gammaproteobacteria bacterium]
MLGSKKSAFNVSGGTTLISTDAVIVGDIHFSGNLDIEGLVQGNIVAQPGKDALVRVVGKGRVEGEIHAPGVIINGTVQGDVHSSKHLELAPKGRVQGNVFYALVEMAAGSEVNGSLTHIVVADPATQKMPDPGAEVVEAGKKAKPAAAFPADRPAKDQPAKVD